MDKAVKSFVERANIARFIGQIETETDPVKYQLLTTLLAEEEDKQRGSRMEATQIGV